MIARGDVLVPTIGGRPWLEKPPMAWWLVALAGRIAGGVSEAAARAPSALAATALALGVATLAARRFGATVGLLAGLVQASTSWTVMRGRLAEADMLLACLVTWTVVAFDRLPGRAGGQAPWRWAFFAGLGLTALAKGIGFGAVMVGASVALVVAWDRDREALRRLRFWPGWALAGTVGADLAGPDGPAPPVGPGALDAARDRPPGESSRALRRRAVVAVRPRPARAGPALDPAGPAGGRPVAGPRLRRPRPGRGRPPPLGLGGRAGRAPLAGDGQERPLRDPRAPPLVDLGRPGPDAARRAAARDAAGRPIGSVGAPGSASRASAWPSAWDSPSSAPGSTAAGSSGPSTRTPAASCGRASRSPCSTTTGTATRIRRRSAPSRTTWPSASTTSTAPPAGGSASTSLADRPPAPSREAFAVIGRDRDLPGLRRLGRVETVARGPATRFDRTYALFRITPGEWDLAAKAGGRKSKGVVSPWVSRVAMR